LFLTSCLFFPPKRCMHFLCPCAFYMPTQSHDSSCDYPRITLEGYES
jgi:hypothetical protein